MTMFYQPYRRQQEPVSMTRLYNNIVIILCTGKKKNLGLCALVKPMKVNQGWQVFSIFILINEEISNLFNADNIVHLNNIVFVGMPNG